MEDHVTAFGMIECKPKKKPVPSHQMDRFAALPADEQAAWIARAMMRHRLVTLFEAESPNADDVLWLRGLCDAIKARVAALTPRRPDLLASWESAFDVDLFMQMFDHHALEEADADRIAEVVFERLELLCAPSQDAAIANVKGVIVEERSVAKKMALLLEISGAILADIEQLRRDALERFERVTAD